MLQVTEARLLAGEGEGLAGSRAWTKGPATIEAMIEAMIKGPHGFAAKAKDALVELIG